MSEMSGVLWVSWAWAVDLLFVTGWFSYERDFLHRHASTFSGRQVITCCNAHVITHTHTYHLLKEPDLEPEPVMEAGQGAEVKEEMAS